ncbi:MAG: hypothetical protein R2911_00550 [Caldilineaceae bacterium]
MAVINVRNVGQRGESPSQPDAHKRTRDLTGCEPPTPKPLRQTIAPPQ